MATDQLAQDAISDAPAAHSIGELAVRAAREVATLEAEIAEIDMLIAQAQTEATRHEQKRAQQAEKHGAAVQKGDQAEAAQLATQLVQLTRRAAVMDGQVEVLNGKRRALARYLETMHSQADALASLSRSAEGSSEALDSDGLVMSPAVSRMVLGVQEDLRREIARAMHDGPAQSLTNIVLQAQIVERILARDPEQARGEVRLLVSMVQQTLDATKNFIFEVRPMVLDDLGLVPTLRRAARERGRRAGVAVDFESLGADHRLPMDLESGLFRILDEALGGYLSVAPDRVQLRLDWGGDMLEARVVATRAVVLPPDDDLPEAPPLPTKKGQQAPALPPALQAMIDDRKEDREKAVAAAHEAAIVSLPTPVWREIQQRAATIGTAVELLAGGGELRLAVPLASGAAGDAAGATAAE